MACKCGNQRGEEGNCRACDSEGMADQALKYAACLSKLRDQIVNQLDSEGQPYNAALLAGITSLTKDAQNHRHVADVTRNLSKPEARV